MRRIEIHECLGTKSGTSQVWKLVTNEGNTNFKCLDYIHECLWKFYEKATGKTVWTLKYLNHLFTYGYNEKFILAICFLLQTINSVFLAKAIWVPKVSHKVSQNVYFYA